MGGAKSSCITPYSSIYEIQALNIDNIWFNLNELKNKILLIVNVASRWGLTKLNYSQLIQIEALYFKEGLRILLFPCNQFKQQEPGTNEEIKEFIQEIGGNFQVFSKIDVNGKNACVLYKFLRLHSNLKGDEIGWNFGKFLVNRDGNRIKFFTPQTQPLKISEYILELL